MLFAAVAHLADGLSLEALLQLNVEKFLICFMVTRRPTASITKIDNFVLGKVKKYSVKMMMMTIIITKCRVEDRLS
jgi:carbon starvation protein CstA